MTTDSGYAFLQRFPDRRVDEADIAARTPMLAEFIRAVCANHDLANRPIAIGFSNGAIMAAALLLTDPELFAGGVLFRPLSPFAHDLPHRLARTPVLIIDGMNDSRRSPGDGLRLTGQLRRAGARVTHRVLSERHALAAEDAMIARAWLRPLLA